MTTPGEFLDFAYRTALAAGSAILPHFREPIAIEDKGTGRGYDPVTEADRGAEHVIRAAIQGAYPDHGMRGEEHGWLQGNSRYTWVIDPIDGTRSFILGQLHWATLIAVNDGEKVLAGVAHQPFVGESFLASADGPALWRRGTEERVLTSRPCARLAEAVVACTDPKMFATSADLCAFQRVAEEARLVRYGGDCYAYCLLAMGLVDVVIESTLRAWDVQALMPIVERAGGVITTWDGGRCDEGGSVIACGDPGLHAKVLEILQSA
ncbi:MAG TPA: histidinol-phosphatase [Casimicrobiaceae bacterium]|nr:histidinol-phosphatase [Casimicrobiaceae bacterium]